MKVGIMQPYFFPYIGYWQLINAVDKFIVYDNIQFTKKSWIRRNKILLNDKDKLFTIPLKKDSDYLDVRERYISDEYTCERKKLLNQIRIAYNKAPQFNNAFPIIEECINFNNYNLFEYIYNSIIKVRDYLEIDTDIIVSSNINMNHSLCNKYKVMEICNILEGDTYINPMGGINLYSKEEFYKGGIKLSFLKTAQIEYKQYSQTFISNLSIIDVMMFNSVKDIKKLLEKYELL